MSKKSEFRGRKRREGNPGKNQQQKSIEGNSSYYSGSEDCGQPCRSRMRDCGSDRSREADLRREQEEARGFSFQLGDDFASGSRGREEEEKEEDSEK